MADWFEDAIQQAVNASRLEFEDKAEAVRYYTQKYPHMGKGGWKQHIVHDLSSQTGQKPKTLEKRFDAGPHGRLTNPELRNKKQYQDLARSLGLRKAPPGGYHVHYEGWVTFSPPNCDDQRTFDVDITGNLADEVASYPERVIDIAFRVYMQQEHEDESSAGPCDDNGDPEITITANADDYRPPTRKRHKAAIPFFK